MPAPFKQSLTIAVGALKSGGACIAAQDIRAIQFDGNLTGSSFYLEGATITNSGGTAGAQPADSAYSEMLSTAAARVSFTKQPSKLIVLSEAQRDHFAACHYVRAVASEPQATNDAVITLIGRSMYK